MIHIDADFGRLAALCGERPYLPAPPPSDRAVVSTSGLGRVVLDEAAHVYGLVHRGKVPGAAAHLARPGAIPLPRHEIYALAPLDDVFSAAIPMIKAISAAHGPGDWWTVGEPIQVICDDGRAKGAVIDGMVHVLLRSIYYHSPQLNEQTIAIRRAGRKATP